MEPCRSGRTDITANDGSGLNPTAGSNPAGSAIVLSRDRVYELVAAQGFFYCWGLGSWQVVRPRNSFSVNVRLVIVSGGA